MESQDLWFAENWKIKIWKGSINSTNISFLFFFFLLLLFRQCLENTLRRGCYLWIQCSASLIRNLIIHFGFCCVIQLLPPFRWQLRSDRPRTWWSPSPSPKRRRRRRIPTSPPSPCRPTPSSSETPRQPSRDRIPTPPLETYPRSWRPCGTGWGRSRSRYGECFLLPTQETDKLTGKKQPSLLGLRV